MKTGILLIIIGCFLTAVSQALLKLAVKKYGAKSIRIKDYLNPYVVTGYLLMFITTILSVFALKAVPLSLLLAMESLTYVFVLVFSFFVFKEKIKRDRFIGVFLILLGILIIYV